jgi:hypothetical protein
MSNDFNRSIGGGYGSGPITAKSVGIGQSPGSAVAGYNVSYTPTGAGVPPPQDGPHGSAPARTAPKASASGPKNAANKNTFTRNDGTASLKPSKMRG